MAKKKKSEPKLKLTAEQQETNELKKLVKPPTVEELAKKFNASTGLILYERQIIKRVYSSGIPALDFALGQIDPYDGNGGYMEGTIGELFGGTASFKSGTWELGVGALHQKYDDELAAVLLSEEPDTRRWERHGIDRSRLITFNAYERVGRDDIRGGEEILKDFCQLSADRRIKYLIIDSLKSLIPSSMVYKGKNEKDLDDREPALRARVIDQAFDHLKYYRSSAILLMINHLTDTVGVDFTPGRTLRTKTNSGRRKEFEALVRMNVCSYPLDIKATNQKDEDLRWGLTVRWHIEKNRWANCIYQGRSAEADYCFETSSFNIGDQLFGPAVALGLIKACDGNRYLIGNNTTSLHGAPLVKQVINENPDLANALYLKIMARHNDYYYVDRSEDKRQSRHVLQEVFQPPKPAQTLGEIMKEQQQVPYYEAMEAQ